MTSSHPPPFVQRGFTLPSFGINPSILSGIPEGNASAGGTSGGSSGNSNSNSAGSSSSPAFVIPHLRTPWSNSDAGNGSSTVAGGLGHSSNDEFAEALQSLVNMQGSGNNSMDTSVQNNVHQSKSGSLDKYHAPYSFSGYQPSPPASATSPVTTHHHHNTNNLSQSLPSFLRHHSNYASENSQHGSYQQQQQQQQHPGSGGYGSGGNHQHHHQDGTETPRSPIDVRHGSGTPGGGTTNNSNTDALFASFTIEQNNPLSSSMNSGKFQPRPHHHNHHHSDSFSSAFAFGVNVTSPPQSVNGEDAAILSSSANSRRDRNSPSDDQKGGTNSLAGSRGRTASTGKAPPSRPSRSRTRRPSYSRTVSPGSANSQADRERPGTSNTAAIIVPSSSIASGSLGISNGGTQGNSNPGSKSSSNSPYLPGYPSQSGAASRGVGGNGSYGMSVPSYLSGSTSGTGYSFNNPAFQHHRRQSDASGSFAPSSYSNDSPLVTAVPLPISEDNSGNNPGISRSQTSNASGLPGSVPSSAPSAFGGFAASGSPNTVSGMDDMRDSKEDKPPVDDKRRKRRESHNAVERRRRDNINERITELATLIPEILLDPTAATGVNGSGDQQREGSANNDSPGDGSGNNTTSGLVGSPPLPISKVNLTPAQLAQQQASNKPNKGVILTKSVEYIRYLQQMVQVQAERNRELEARVKVLEGGGSGMQQGMGSGGGYLNGSSHYHMAGSPLLSQHMVLSTVEERLVEENESGQGNNHMINHASTSSNDSNQMTFEDLLGVATHNMHCSPSAGGKMDDIDESMAE